MNALLPIGTGVTTDSGGITLAPETMSALLNVPAPFLMTEMRRRNVHGLVERGVGEDEGRTRITLRWRGREAVVILEGDRVLESTFNEHAPPPAPHLLEQRLRMALKAQAQDGVPVTYDALASSIGFHRHDAGKTVEAVLGRIAETDAAGHSPLIAALAIRGQAEGLPGPAFFEALLKAGRIDRMPDELEAYALHAAELHRVLARFSRPGQVDQQAPEPGRQGSPSCTHR